MCHTRCVCGGGEMGVLGGGFSKDGRQQAASSMQQGQQVTGIRPVATSDNKHHYY